MNNQSCERLSQQSVDVATNGERSRGVVTVQRPRHADSKKIADGKLAVTIQNDEGDIMTGVIEKPEWVLIDDE